MLKKAIKTLFKASMIAAYFALIVVLVWQALTPGTESAQNSTDFADKLDSIATQVQQDKDVVNVESVEVLSIKVGTTTVDIQDATILVGESGKINTKVYPEDATDKSLTYTSSNSKVIKTYSNGKIVAKSKGSAKITVTSKSNNQIKAEITVVANDIKITSLQIANIPQEFSKGQKHTLEIDYTPNNTTQKNVVWSSSDSEVIKISSSGVMEALAEGVATITAKSAVDESIVSSATITVLPQVVLEQEPVQSISIQSDGGAYVGKSQQLGVAFYPAESSDGILWSSSDTSVATVSQKGVVKYLKAGRVTITASCANFDKQATFDVDVDEVLSTSIQLQTQGLQESEDGFVLRQGSSASVESVLDSDATIFEVTYTSSNDDVASIGQDGVISANKSGTVTITATTTYKGQSTTASFVLEIEKIPFSETIKNFYLWVRKGFGHFGAFLVLGIFATATYYILFAKTLKGKLIGFAVCMFAGFAVAGITEILQLPIFTPGRTASFKDVMLDFRGYCCSSLVLYAVIFIVHFAKQIRHKNKN